MAALATVGASEALYRLRDSLHIGRDNPCHQTSALAGHEVWMGGWIVAEPAAFVVRLLSVLGACMLAADEISSSSAGGRRPLCA